MGHRFAEIAFTESVRELQAARGSRPVYAGMESGEDSNQVLGPRETDFIRARDSFYMASVSETGWPYVQHRGGPAGFMRVIDAQTLGFADFSGNRQYVSTGNLKRDDRVSLFFMDYPNRTRLKLLGRVRLIDEDDVAGLAALEVEDYRARVERGFVIHVEAFDWNCPQHITPRFTQSQIDEMIAPLVDENRALKAGLADVRPVPPAVLGDGPLELVISAVRQLTPRIRAYELRDPHGAELPAVAPGAHLDVPVVLVDGTPATRSYSICSNPARRDTYEIAVLREADGRGGSRAAHALFELGLRLCCGLPRNDFPLYADARPAVLIAGGIGITPIRAMAQALKARGNPMALHYAGRSAKEMAFADRLQREFGAQITLYRGDAGERLDVEGVLSSASPDALFYVCGPERLIAAVSDAATALGIDPGRLRVERFGATIDATARPIELELRRSGRQLTVAADQSVLDAMLDAGIDAPFGCRAGNCRSCAVKVLGGEPEHRDSALSAIEREEAHLMCPCVSRARGNCLVLDF